MLRITDPSRANAHPSSGVPGRHSWPARLVALRPLEHRRGGPLTPFDLEAAEAQILAFRAKLAETDAESETGEEGDADSNAGSEESDVDVSQENVHEEWMWRLAEERDWGPNESRHLCFVESAIALPTDVVCVECGLEGKTFSKTQMSHHPDERRCEDCINKMMNSAYRPVTPGATGVGGTPTPAAPASRAPTPALPAYSASFGNAPNVATCSKCFAQLTKQNCTTSQRQKPPSRRRCNACINAR